MSLVNQQAGSDTIRRHLFSLSSVFRSRPSKRPSITDPVQEEPTCQERIHYPVFNPLDPRHNPEISTSSWRPNQQRSLTSESRTPKEWVQSVSKRTLHKARSGLLALRSGFSHRSSEEDNPEKCFVGPVALRQERQRQAISSEAYTSDTQEDVNFGAELSRMHLPPSSPSSSTEVGSLIRIRSLGSIPDSFATFHGAASSPLFYPPSRAVSNSGVNSRCTLATDHNLAFQFGGTGDLEANTDSEDHFAHTMPSTENHLTQQTWGVAISTDGEIKMSSHDLPDPGSICEEQEQQATNLHQQNIRHASSDTEISDYQPSLAPISRQSSAEVRFAFPGIYQETLHQWGRQHDSPSPSQHTPNPSAESPNTSRHSSSLGQHRPNLSENSPRLHEQEQAPCNSPNPLKCIVLQDDTYNNLPPYNEIDESFIPLVPSQTPINRSEEMQPLSYLNPLNFISNRNFGERWPSTSERATTQRSSVEDDSSRSTPADTTSRDLTSTEMTSMESMTNDTWSPWSPVESELLFPSPVEDGNGYFLVDGKTSSQYPDSGNQPVKCAQHSTSNYDTTRAPQQLNRLISPGIMSQPLIPDGIPGAGLDFVEDDTDDEFYPGIVHPRQFW
ncbi:hypothetical protein ACN38_g7083 [Penicillium nordicum]|uniref:Uncharacterized protein n=1 Tax=Penicillium nordicum TaxID=229535 RepID=A0A0M9WEP1_9EURO|nr:hypothetical protein ACN38_g7083 [Penicillium nordicum]